MSDFLSIVIYPVLFAFLGAGATKVWDWLKPKPQRVLEQQDILSRSLEAEIKSAEFYRSLLDDAQKRIDQAIQQLEERDKRIRERDEMVRERDSKIDLLIKKVDALTHELEKYKQLNGKIN